MHWVVMLFVPLLMSSIQMSPDIFDKQMVSTAMIDLSTQQLILDINHILIYL